MTIASWLRGLTRTLKNSIPSQVRPRDNRYRPRVELLEDRSLLSSYGLGSAFGLGSTGTENAHSVTTDGSGNMLVAGNFSSAFLDLDPGPGTYILPNAGGSDGFVAKYDPAGNVLWGVQVGGTSNYGSVYEVEADGAGNVLIAGIFAGSVDIGAPGRAPVTLTTGATYEGFLAKLDPAGNAFWARTFGAAADPRVAYGITTDAAGNVYATGSEGNRLFVAKYSADGAAVWTQVVSGAGTLATGTFVSGECVAVDSAGNVLVVGPYSSKIDFNPDPLKTNYLTSINRHPYDNAFVLKLNATGAYVWAGSMGGPSGDLPTGVAVDAAGNVLVSGIYGADSKKSKNDFDPGPGVLSLPGTGGSFVVKLDPNRNLIWARSGVGERAMALDAAGNVYTTGRSGPNVFVNKLNSSGSFVWAADILTGGPVSNGVSFDIAVDGAGNVYTSGLFKGTVDMDPGAGTYALTSTPDSIGNPTMDAFVSKLVPSNALQAAVGTSVDDEPHISISDVAKNEGKKGQTTLFTFTVTLSAAYDQAVTMSFQTVNGTASTSDNDYVAKTGTLTFAPGETTKTITIEVKGDSKKEANETFYVDLFGNSGNSLFTKNRGLGTILNDD